MKLIELIESKDTKFDNPALIGHDIFTAVAKIIKDECDVKITEHEGYRNGNVLIGKNWNGILNLRVLTNETYIYIEDLDIDEKYADKGLSEKIVKAIVDNVPKNGTIKLMEDTGSESKSFWHKMKEKFPKVKWEFV